MVIINVINVIDFYQNVLDKMNKHIDNCLNMIVRDLLNFILKIL